MAHHIADDQCGEEDEYHDQDDELTGVIVCSMADQMSDDGEEDKDEELRDVWILKYGLYGLFFQNLRQKYTVLNQTNLQCNLLDRK